MKPLACLFALATAVAFGQETESGSAAVKLGDGLRVEQQSKAGAAQKDRRLFVSEVTLNQRVLGEMGQDAAAASVAIAKASVEVSGAKLYGESLNTFTGTGFLVGSRCHVVTARHNINKGKLQRYKDGLYSQAPDSSASPLNARVKIEHGLTGKSDLSQNAGTVLSIGSFDDGINGDFALIRLDKPAPANLAPILLGDDNDLAAARMMAFGLPADKRSTGERQIVIDPVCKIVNSTRVRIETDCLGAPGMSGGPIAALVEVSGSRSWGIVGMTIRAERTVENGDTHYGNIIMLNLKEIYPILWADIKSDLTNHPCQ